MNLKKLARQWALRQAKGGARSPGWAVSSIVKGLIFVGLQFVIDAPGFLLGFIGLLFLVDGVYEFERAGFLLLLDEVDDDSDGRTASDEVREQR
jgi:hypothetical protein